MGYYPLDFQPGLLQLARNFTVCDHWFSSLPGPTWPNHFFALSGTCLGHVDMPNDGTHKADLAGYFQQTQDTIFDRLNEKQISWKVYFHDLPQSWTMKQLRAPHNAAQYYYIRRFYEVVLSSPDKVDQKYTSERNRVVRFLATQKSRAVQGLTERVANSNGRRSPAEQQHAAKMLAAILGRRVYADQLSHAKRWLRRIVPGNP